MYCGVALSALLFLAASVIPRQLMLIFTTDEEIILQGIAYLRVIRFTYLVFAVAQILLYTLRIVGTVRISLYLSVTALLLNCFWNYALIYGRFGFPSYGVAGVAAATLISRLVELGILIGYLALREDKLRLTWRLYLLSCLLVIPR
jgi:Na+-driven multidrug efflux pump